MADARRMGMGFPNRPLVDTKNRVFDDSSLLTKGTTVLTPLQILMLLHYHFSPPEVSFSAHNPAHATSRAVINQRQQLMVLGLIERVPTGALQEGYKTTDRGEAHVAALKNLPLPVAIWVTPRPKGDGE